MALPDSRPSAELDAAYDPPRLESLVRQAFESGGDVPEAREKPTPDALVTLLENPDWKRRDEGGNAPVGFDQEGTEDHYAQVSIYDRATFQVWVGVWVGKQPKKPLNFKGFWVLLAESGGIRTPEWLFPNTRFPAMLPRSSIRPYLFAFPLFSGILCRSFDGLFGLDSGLRGSPVVARGDMLGAFTEAFSE